ncbi:MAG: hypothetical protein J0G32_02730 [Alphaproteobacteria bacterium]|nr:hypothetical protein [Alphaproteobacteria bacterium]OJV13918.1 MAG: hypothetical protein BGO27_08495 [Alphaproteobacteria bacterium 33-17]
MKRVIINFLTICTFFILTSCSNSDLSKIAPVYSSGKQDSHKVFFIPEPEMNQNIISYLKNKDDITIVGKVEEIATNTKYVIGPVKYNDTVNASKLLPKTKFFSLSNNIDIAGKNIYLLGVHPHDQINALLKYHSVTGMKNLYVIAPRSKLNSDIISYINQSVSKYNMTVAKIEQYTESSLDYSVKSVAANLSTATQIDGILILGHANNLRDVFDKFIEKKINIDNFRVLGLNQYDDLSESDKEIMKNVYFAGSYDYENINNKFLLYYLDGLAIIDQIKQGKKANSEFIVYSGTGKFSKHVFKRALRVFTLGTK